MEVAGKEEQDTLAERLRGQGPWKLAARSHRMNSSLIRELLGRVGQPGMISFAGGLPSSSCFPVEALREASDRVLRTSGQESLQYGPSEGYGPLREWVVESLGAQGYGVSLDQVLITNGSQQGLDLVGKVLIDAGSHVAVEQPSYLGALQALAPFEPEFLAVAGDEGGPFPDLLRTVAGARFLYIVPNFQNPSGRCLTEERRGGIARQAEHQGLPILEDNPYGDLWFGEPPPKSLAARWAEGTIYLGSFSKVLAPGLRLGYLVSPSSGLAQKLVQAKQAADLQAPSFNQRLVYEVIRDGFLDGHIANVRAKYARQRDAMHSALERHLPAGCYWDRPAGGMFFWIRLPSGVDAADLLEIALRQGVAFLPGGPFHAINPHLHTNNMRLSFTSATALEIEEGISRIGRVVSEFLA